MRKYMLQNKHRVEQEQRNGNIGTKISKYERGIPGKLDRKSKSNINLNYISHSIIRRFPDFILLYDCLFEFFKNILFLTVIYEVS
jgi:hypothetical protein